MCRLHTCFCGSAPCFCDSAPCVCYSAPYVAASAPCGQLCPVAFVTLPRTFVTLPRALVALPSAVSTLPRAFATLPRTFVTLPRTFATLPRAFATLPRAFATLPRPFVTLPLAAAAWPGLLELLRAVDRGLAGQERKLGNHHQQQRTAQLGAIAGVIDANRHRPRLPDTGCVRRRRPIGLLGSETGIASFCPSGKSPGSEWRVGGLRRWRVLSRRQSVLHRLLWCCSKDYRYWCSSSHPGKSRWSRGRRLRSPP